MVKLQHIIFILFLIFLFIPRNVTAQEKKIFLFWGQGCPHCAQVNQYFEEKGFYDKYPIERKEIYNNKPNANLLNEYFEKYQVPLENRGVPAIFIGKNYLIGGADIPNQFESLADEFIKNRPGETKSQTFPTLPTTLPRINLLLPAVIAGALADSVNPCEFAVLILLLTAILASGSSKRALKAGLLFSLAIFTSYLAMGLGLYKALTWGNLPRIFLVFIGFLAIVLGLFNLKDYFWYGKGGFLMEVPMSWRPHLKTIISRVTSPGGAFFIGFLVSLFLLPCTSGPYIIILGMLSQKTNFTQAFAYLVFYNIIFILPMIFITLAVYKGFSLKQAEEFRQKKLRLLHLIIGLLLVGMGGVVLAGWI